MLDPAEEHAEKLLTDHAKDFHRYLASKGNTPAYVVLTLTRLLACLDGCRFVKIADVGPTAVLSFLADLLKQDLPRVTVLLS